MSSNMKGGKEGSQERVPTVEEREEGTGEHGEGTEGIPMSRSSVVTAAPSRPWQDKRQRSSRARITDLLPKPSRVGFDSIMSQAAETLQERLGTTHDFEGLDGVAKLKKVLPEAAHLTGKDSLMNAAADALERHPPV